MAYNGFISYSHAADGQLAPALQQGLQRLAKPWNHRRALRIFRDETGLSTNPHLWSAIEGALDESEWFVLLATPEAAQSEWVNKEISHWLATKSVARMLPVVTDGTWVWDASAGDFTASSSAVPEALRGTLADEPRHLDLRWARSETDLDLRNSRFRSAIADLAAPMHGVAKDELEGEDVRQHRRARRLARVAASTLVLLLSISMILAVLAVNQRNQAQHNAGVATQRQRAAIASSVATAAVARVDNVDLSLLLATAAYRLHDAPDTRGALTDTLAAASHLSRVDYLPGAPIIAAASAVGGAELALARADGHFELWRTDPLRQVTRVDAGAAIAGLAVSPDGRFLVLQTQTNVVELRQLPSGGLVRRYKAHGFLEGAWSGGAPLAFSPDSRRLAFIADSGVGLVDTATGAHGHVMAYGGVKSLAFAGDATHIVVGTITAGVVLMSLSPSAPLRIASYSHLSINVELASALATPQGNANLIAFGSTSGDVGVYSRSEQRTIWLARGAHDGVVHTVAFDPASRLVASTGNDGRVRLWERGTGAPWGVLGGVGGAQVAGFFVGVPPGSGSRDVGGGDVVRTISPRGVATWKLDAVAIGARRVLPQTPGCQTPSSGLTLAGTVFVSFAACGYVWDLSARRPASRPLVPERAAAGLYPFIDAAVARDGALSMYVTAAGITMFDTHTGTRTRTILKGVSDLADGRVALSPDGREVTVAGPEGPNNTAYLSSPVRSQIRTFDVATGERTRTTSLPTHVVDALSYSPDGRLIAVGNEDGTIDLYNPATGTVSLTKDRTPTREIDAIAFAPNGRWFAAASSDGTVRIIDLPSGRERNSLMNPGAGALARVAISPDSRTLAVVSWTGKLSRWDMPTSTEIGGNLAVGPEGTSSVPDLLEAPLPSVVFIDADRIATSSLDNSVTIWDFDSATLARTACRLAGRDLTRAEWTRYMTPLPYTPTCT